MFSASDTPHQQRSRWKRLKTCAFQNSGVGVGTRLLVWLGVGQARPAAISCFQISPWSTTSTPSFSAFVSLLAPTSAPVIR